MPERIYLQVEVPIEFRDDIRLIAKEEDRTINAVVIRALRDKYPKQLNKYRVTK